MKKAIQYVMLFAAFSLALHFITVYLLCHGTGLLLARGDMLNSPEKWEIRENAETIMGQAGMLGNVFIASCYLFFLTIGAALVIRKITAAEYVISVLHQKAARILFILPLLISAGRRIAAKKK